MTAANLAASAVAPSASTNEAALAGLRALEGDDVVVRRGCHWRSIYPGFYQPIHLLARIRAEEARAPARLCWGFRAALAPEDASMANASIPLHLLGDVRGFHEGVLCRNRRSDLRRSRRVAEFHRLDAPTLLFEQGHDVFMSAVQRLGHWHPLTERAYRLRVARRLVHGPRLLVVALVGGRLRGYIDSYAVEGVLYTDEIFVATDALRTGVGTGLYVETLLAAAADGSVHDVCNGLHRPEDPNLCRFKEGLGFRVVHVPARASIRPPMRAYLRTRRPGTYYRLTGDATALGAIRPLPSA